MTAQIQQYDLVDDDRKLINEIQRGYSVLSFEKATPKFRELTTGILFQFADSQLAGSAGYNSCLNWGPTLDDRIALGMIIVEKMEMARKTYSILANQNLNVEKYFASHSWHAKVLRDADLGFRRASADKRLNALMYPLESWVDVAVFTHLMSSMTCHTLHDFRACSFAPLKELAETCLPVEKSHEAFGETQLRKIAKLSTSKLVVQSSLNYWYPRVVTSFGPAESTRNDLHRQFRLKTDKSYDLRQKWKKQVQDFFLEIKVDISISDSDNATACN